ncbi:Arc family DNA-binding protein [Methylorubrum rhodesianum]|uniref:Arc family DNA-binding protein n=1 Tax=Methylorubrum rhodesianum TaxID=29427 RepID=UPI003D2C88F5
MARDPYPSETQDRFLLRMPDGMRDRLKAEAEANKRSMNAEIVARLEASLSDQPGNDLNLSPGQKQFFELMQDDIRHAMRSALNRWHLYAETFPDDGPHKYFDEAKKK